VQLYQFLPSELFLANHTYSTIYKLCGEASGLACEVGLYLIAFENVFGVVRMRFVKWHVDVVCLVGSILWRYVSRKDFYLCEVVLVFFCFPGKGFFCSNHFIAKLVLHYHQVLLNVGLHNNCHCILDTVAKGEESQMTYINNVILK